MERLKQSSASGKAAKKAEKKASKEAKKEKKRAASQMEAALAAKDVGPAVIDPQAPARRQADSDYPSRRNDSDSRQQRHPASRHDESHYRQSRGDRDDPRYRRGDSRHDYREGDDHPRRRMRLHSPERANEADHDRQRSSDHQHAHSDRGHPTDNGRQHENGHATARDSHKRDVRGASDGREHAPTNNKGGAMYGLSWGETAPEELQARNR